ncbi:MAG: hypothetical protein PVF49_10080 [Anaerolineales bacterium]|jgi:hypothetical protein
MKKRIPPALALFVLAPTVGELISGSAPPVEFLNPFSFFLLAALYGSGALLAREFSLRWNKRWPTIVMLGLAYAIIEEGLMVKSFFDPAWMDLGDMANYGRWLGVNWPWTVELMIYHALVSIAIPIQLVELIYPEKRDQRWLTRRGMRAVAILLALDVAFGFLFLTTYHPPAGPYLLAVLVTAALFLWARALPAEWPPLTRVDPFSYRRIILTGLAFTMGVFIGAAIFPGAGWSPILSILFMVLVSWFGYRLIRRASGYGAWDDLGRLALIRGALLPLNILGALREFAPDQPDNPAGMTLVGVLTLLGLWWLARVIRKRTQEEPPPEVLLPFRPK